ncbi:hypothetical protein AVHY2522_09400 [Acidovorax sp. SUPP2522]|uniref:hypothetical protein n=1 Tax=unclassified Acidovorax TaxID=2684926 RepID=UPI00234934DE|nr:MULTISPECIES: hypothetical protein [unclassified Acidovorax]WCM95788.1 hypothetical protein M5C96_15050 [Acidovorax sp. GBBC 1281]GKT15806.1 hypothetical protein AVHY2522_09400 [Acidovorax sp. SUPP2522]
MTRKSWPFLSTYQERSPEQNVAFSSADATKSSAGQSAISFGMERVGTASSPMNHTPLRCSDFTIGNLSPSVA